MKSAYELAMERLRASEGDTKPLTDEQKQQLAEIETRYRAKLAEREVFLQGKLDQARRERNAKDMEQLETQLRNERSRLREEMEAAKESIRKAG